MCCITETLLPAPSAIRRHHRKSSSMDSFFLCKFVSTSATSKDSSSSSALSRRGSKVAPAPGPDGPSKDEEAPKRTMLSRRRSVSPVAAPAEPGASSAGVDEAMSRHVTRRSEKVYNKKTVRFASVHIREYAPIVGDNPSCTDGLPVQLGWEHAPTWSVKGGVDAYEKSRVGSRTTCSGNLAAIELRMSRRRRMELLIEAGGIHPMELVRRERTIRMRERDEFFGRK
eukprot:CAMPEP_0197442958 /NCGR_PEP_ID=MMETSP1175-20131217/8841_1 /TAXON_ID=1003142 /ORGANISM="Triceratium dubium, Strain CCMP147" /LENGTH=226 /DNA_ID=CAMNT_0042973527 /DNA_START=204 /DNA_END=884 /DNA_ORIENTATION=-